MYLLRQLMEIADKAKPGTYAGVHFDDDTVSKLVEYTIDAKIDNALTHEDFHTTLLYSRKHCSGYKAAGTYDKPMIATNLKLDIWHPKKESGEDNTDINILVIKFKCPELSKRHNELMKEYEAEYDFDEYIPHVTLSYNAGKIDLNSLPDISKYLDKLIIESEYGEDLKSKWSEDK